MSERQPGGGTTAAELGSPPGEVSTTRMPDVSCGLLSYPERSRIHRRATGDQPGEVTLFSDAAGTRLIKGWTQDTPVGLTLYREVQLVPSESSGQAETVPWPEVGGEVVPSSGAMEGCRAAGAAIRRLVWSQGIRVHGAGGEGIIALVRGSSDPRVVRGVWRALGRLRILDPACGGGEWLWGCLQLLGAVGIACLERMRGWVGDAADTPIERRRFADFRGSLVRWEEMAREGCRDRLAFERALSGCLYGIDPDATSIAECRRRLAGVLAGTPTLDEAFVDIRQGRPSVAAAAWKEIIVPEGARGWEEALMLDRAAAQLRNLRLSLNASAADAAAGWWEIARRRSDLRRLSRREGDGTTERAPLIPWLEYPEILTRGGFHLARGAEEAAAAEVAGASEN